MKAGHIVMLLFALGWVVPAQAELHRCRQADGSQRYQDTPCAADEEAHSEPMPGAPPKSITTRASGHAARLHPSWFDAPRYMQAAAQCDEAECRCGTQRVTLQWDLRTRLLNALTALPSLWRFHDSAVRRYQELGARQSQYPAMREDLAVSACRIHVEQKVLEALYPHTADQLLGEHAEAERALAALEGQCGEVKETGWTNSESAKRWVECRNRLSSERNALARQSRNLSGTADALRRAMAGLTVAREP